MIQITAQMRVLVAIEPVDGRNYALSLDMRSFSIAHAEFKSRFGGNHRPGMSSSA
jgi:hypothetical protein